MKNTNYEVYLEMSPEELKALQKKNGWTMYFIGSIVYMVLIWLGFKPKSFYGICPYFEIGSNWGGLEMGWFFICSKHSSDRLKSHEVGHSVQNAAIGGLKMLALSIGSAVRYWWRNIFGAKTPYDAWWFEGQATEIGLQYVAKHKKQ